MVKIIETQMQGVSHYQINKAIIEIFSKNNEFIFWGDQSQINMLKEDIGLPVSNNILVQQYAKKWQLPFYILYHFFYILKILLTSKKNDKIIFTSLFPVTHFLIKPFFIFSKSNKYIVLHGELKQIDVYANFFLKILGKFLKKALLFKTPRTKYIILGEFIKNAILEKKWLNINEIICLEHPYDFSLKIEKQNNNNFIKIVSIGAASVNKGVHHFFNLAAKNKNPILKFYLVGAVLDNKLTPFLNNFVSYSKDIFLTNEEYNKELSNASLAIFFLDEKEYKYTASAAFLDTVKYKIPIFAVKNNLFSYYFSKYGELGILFESENDLEKFVLEENIKNILEENKLTWELNFSKIINSNKR